MATIGEMAIVTSKDDTVGRIMVCTDAWVDTFSDDGPEPMATWRDVTDAERATPEYARLTETIEATRRQHNIWDRNSAAAKETERAERAARTSEQKAADQAYYDNLPSRAATDDLSVITKEDEDLLDQLFG